MVRVVATGMVVDAFGGEAERLAEMGLAAEEAAFSRVSPCSPWTVGELLCHVRIGVSRIPGMLG
jgi:hypothetical protein